MFRHFRADICSQSRTDFSQILKPQKKRNVLLWQQHFATSWVLGRQNVPHWFTLSYDSIQTLQGGFCVCVVTEVHELLNVVKECSTSYIACTDIENFNVSSFTIGSWTPLHHIQQLMHFCHHTNTEASSLVSYGVIDKSKSMRYILTT